MGWADGLMTEMWGQARTYEEPRERQMGLVGLIGQIKPLSILFYPAHFTS